MAAAAKGFLHSSHPFHQLNNRLLNMPPFLPPNAPPSNGQVNNNPANKASPVANNAPPNVPPKEMSATDKTILKENLNSNASLHLQPLLRSLSAAAAAVQQSNEPPNGGQMNKSLLLPNFSMLPQSMHQLLHPLFVGNLDAAMLNQSANQINHSLNSNSSLISTSSTSSSPVPFNSKAPSNDRTQTHHKRPGGLMSTSDLLNKLNRAELNQSLNINVEDDEDFEILDLENDGESEDLELDVDSGNDFDQSMEKNESCLSNEELSERIALAKSNCKELVNEFDMRSRSPQQMVANNLPSLSSNSSLMIAGGPLPPKPIAVHPLKNFAADQPAGHNLSGPISLTSNMPTMTGQPRMNLPSHLTASSHQPHHSSTPTTNTTNTSPFYNSAASFLQHPLLAEATNSFCPTANPVWPFPFDSNSAAMAAAKFAQFLNNSNK